MKQSILKPKPVACQSKMAETEMTMRPEKGRLGRVELVPQSGATPGVIPAIYFRQNPRRNSKEKSENKEGFLEEFLMESQGKTQSKARQIGRNPLRNW